VKESSLEGRKCILEEEKSLHEKGMKVLMKRM
jgi:hypothetical protein